MSRARGRCGIGARLLRDRSGATAVEFAAILPILAASLLGVIETGRLIWTQSTLHFAVERAARCAAVDAVTCNSTTAVQAYAVNAAASLAVDNSVFTVSAPACGSQVAANYAFSSVVTNLLPFTITLTAQSCFPR